MTIIGEKIRLFAAEADILVLPVFGGDGVTHDVMLERIPEEFRARGMKEMKRMGFTGKAGEAVSLTLDVGGQERLLLIVGLGNEEVATLEEAREMIGSAIAVARAKKLKTVAVEIPVEPEGDVADVAEAIVVAAMLADYAFDTFKVKNGEWRLQSLVLCIQDGRDVLRVRRAVERGQAIAAGTNIARDLVNMPAQSMTPTALVEAAEHIVREAGKNVSLKVLEREECEALGMGAFLAVAQGSVHPPKFIHLTYTPERPAAKRLVVVGKGVTFDSGGLSLKPADAMMTMKCDMAGAAAVLGFFAVLGQLQPRIEVHGIVAATENMPSGSAIRPGDIVRAANGKTIEILNTDAEGRLTLADALNYATGLEPTALVDLATLTGACVVALGEEVAGVMSNNDALAENVLLAAHNAGEKLWRLPLEARYRQLIESDVADLRNIATSRYGGSLTAGLFLQEFVADLPWAHLDIAGPGFLEKPVGGVLAKGASGYGVRTLVELLENI